MNCRNSILSTTYNYDGDIALIGNGSNAGGVTFDIWDTIDDYNNNVSGLPPDIWGEDTDCGGVATSSGDDNVWIDVTITVAGESSISSVDSSRCAMQDKISGLWVSKIQTPKTGLSWSEAWSRCLDLTRNTKDDWRLPTQKELLAIYLHGARSAGSSNWNSAKKMADNFWSGTTVSGVPPNAYDASLARSSVRNIYTYGAPKTNGFNVICVR